MPKLAAALDFNKLEALNIRVHNNGGAPSSPVKGQMYYDTTPGVDKLYWFNGTIWVDATGGSAATPDATTSVKGIVQLAGDLAGTAASPQIAAGVITDADVNSVNKDGAVGTASMRTLGTGAQQAAPGNHTLNSHPAPVAALPMNSQRITGLLDPSSAQDAATKAYVDAVAQGLDAKQSVRAASPGNNWALTGLGTMDGVALADGDRVLLKDQTTPAQNGIYVAFGTGWVRATDQDAWTEFPGAFVFVELGTVNGDSGFVCTNDQGGTLGTTAVTWTQFSGAGQITAGAGMTKTGNTLDVGGTTNRITVGTDTVDIAATYVGQGSITTLGTITTGVWNGSVIPVANGGTGSSTTAGSRAALAAAGYYNNAATHGAGTTIVITAATHGLRASRGLIVQSQDNATGVVDLPDVAVAANGDVTLTYAVSVTANTKLITIVG